MSEKPGGKDSARRELDPRVSELRRLIQLLEDEGVFDAEARKAAAQFLGRLGGLKGGPHGRRN